MDRFWWQQSNLGDQHNDQPIIVRWL